MWAFFSRRFRLWVMFALGVPILRALLGRAGTTLEARTGSTVVTRGLETGHRTLARYDRRERRRAKR